LISRTNTKLGATIRCFRTLVWQRLFDGRLFDRRHALAVFRDHIRQVTEAIPPDRLLVYDVRDGWRPLCAFLDRPVPDVPFPHLNTTRVMAQTQRRFALRRVLLPAVAAAVVAAAVVIVAVGRS
jgi:hypothetical protein